MQWLGLHNNDLAFVRSQPYAENCTKPWSLRDTSLFDGMLDKMQTATKHDPNLVEWVAELRRAGSDRSKCDLEALQRNGLKITDYIQSKILRREWI